MCRGKEKLQRLQLNLHGVCVLIPTVPTGTASLAAMPVHYCSSGPPLQASTLGLPVHFQQPVVKVHVLKVWCLDEEMFFRDSSYWNRVVASWDWHSVESPSLVCVCQAQLCTKSEETVHSIVSTVHSGMQLSTPLVSRDVNSQRGFNPIVFSVLQRKSTMRKWGMRGFFQMNLARSFQFRMPWVQNLLAPGI